MEMDEKFRELYMQRYGELAMSMLAWTGGTELESRIIEKPLQEEDFLGVTRSKVTNEIIANKYFLSNDKTGVWSQYFRATNFLDFVTLARRSLMMIYVENFESYVLAIHPETLIRIESDDLKKEIEKFSSSLTIEIVISTDLPIKSNQLEGWLIRTMKNDHKDSEQGEDLEKDWDELSSHLVKIDVEPTIEKDPVKTKEFREMEQAYNERLKDINDMIFVANCKQLGIFVDDQAKVFISGTNRRYRYRNIDYLEIANEMKQLAIDFEKYLKEVE